MIYFVCLTRSCQTVADTPAHNCWWTVHCNCQATRHAERRVFLTLYQLQTGTALYSALECKAFRHGSVHASDDEAHTRHECV
jgi:hypothetical protein